MAHVKISASTSHLDFGHMYDKISAASAAGVDYIHHDCSDMRSIPGYELMGGGWEIVKGFSPAATVPIEIHAHVHGATAAFVHEMADAGAKLLIFPAIYYMDANLVSLVQACRERGMRFGMTITIGAPLCLVDEAVSMIDRLHIHTHDVTPGIPLRDSALPMVRRARALIDEKNPACELACDGGITPENLHKCVQAGADVLVLGRQIFHAPDGIAGAVGRIRAAIDAASK